MYHSPLLLSVYHILLYNTKKHIKIITYDTYEQSTYTIACNTHC